MYTSCHECGTVFRISTSDLRVAEGYVRCGHCSATFNALTSLTDEPPPTAEPTAAPDLPVDVEPPAAAVRGDDTLEFDIPEGSWSNFFADDVAAAKPDSTDTPPELPTPEVGAAIGSETVDQVGLYRALAAESNGPDVDDDWQALLEEVKDNDATPDPVYVIETDGPQNMPEEALPEEGLTELAIPSDTPWDEPETGDSEIPAPLPVDFATDLAGDESPDGSDVPDALIADRPFAWTPPVAASTVGPGHRWAYTAGCLLLALALLIQVIHQRRDVLATNPTFTAPLQRAYAALGVPLWPAWDLRAYEVRNYEAVADRSSRGALDILARIMVVGNDRVGLPLARITLTDRFGKTLGSRVFEPVEYLGENLKLHELAGPGTLIPVEISLKDPGTDAQGINVDVCLMSQRNGIVCQAEREPFVR